MIDRIIQSLTTVGPLGIFLCLVAGGVIALIIVLNRR